MAISVAVPKNLSGIKTKVAMNLTKRQLICFGSAAAVGIPFYLVTKGVLGTQASALIMVALMLPFFFLAMYEKDGFPAEKILYFMVRQKLLTPGIRPYKSENLYKQREMASGEGSREYSGNQAKEDIQTEIIRSQIAAAKSRNTLQQLISQINHKAASELSGETGGKEGWPDEAWGKDDAGSELLVYADSQLGTPKIRELLQFVQKLDESQYGRLIEELSEVTAQQRMLYFGRKAEGAEEKILEHLAAGENREVLAMIRMRNEKQYETLTEKLSEVISSSDGRASADRAAFDGNRPGGQFLASAYPMLVYRIRQYEARRQRTIHEDMQRVRQAYYRQEGNFSESRQFPAGIRSSGEPANLGHRTNAGNARERISQTNDLQYSVQDFVDFEEERKRDMMRGQQENAQIISTQEQLGKKLKEVEAQLEKVETAAKAKEDVRAFAEQVKKQLYEELHVEKLRRGLI